MRCPKCQYISFDTTERCRNCGYEFSLRVNLEALDLPIQTGDEALGPLRDLTLTDLDAFEGAVTYTDTTAPPPEPVQPPNPAPPQRSSVSSLDLPLFKDRPVDDDTPLVTPAAVPRAPLSVRRSNPVLTRGGSRKGTDEPGLGLEAQRPKSTPRHAPADPVLDSATAAGTSAAAGARVLAALLDAGILGSITGFVVYFTLKLCALQFGELALLPPVPLGAFLLMVVGGYYILFTAACGQTIGKMATGIKVVPEGAFGDRVPLRHAVLRAAAYLVSVLPAGLGLLPALFAADRRAVHDRLADTRVVKA